MAWVPMPNPREVLATLLAVSSRHARCFLGVRTWMPKNVILCKAFCGLGKAFPMLRVGIVQSHQQREEDVC